MLFHILVDPMDNAGGTLHIVEIGNQSPNPALQLPTKLGMFDP